MAALTEQQRRFVLAMASDPFGSQADWARAAGYSDVKDGAKVRASNLIHSPAIEAAVFEVARSSMLTVGPILASQGLLRIAADPKHKRHAWALEKIANRVGLHEVQEVHVHRTDQTGAAMIERIKALAAKMGANPAVLLGSNVVDADFVEVGAK